MFNMLDYIRKITLCFFKNSVKRILSAVRWDPWQQCFWSQEGEDQILARIFENKPSGFYVDVGAHHPKRFSNTYYFYRKGWSGINIDAMPGSMIAFKKERPRDINLEIGVGLDIGMLKYYMFNEPALNSFSMQLSKKRNSEGGLYEIIDIKIINVESLERVFDVYLPANQDVDFLTVDVEGLDFAVLKSNNWSKYRPQYVLVEILGCSLHEIEEGEVGRFMAEHGYRVYAKSLHTVFFKNVAS